MTLEAADAPGCSRCGGRVGDSAPPATFQLLLSGEGEQRKRSRRRPGRPGRGSDAPAPPPTSADGGGDDDDVLPFPPHANAVDLSLVVRDTLLLALSVGQRCPACAASGDAPTVVASCTAEPLDGQPPPPPRGLRSLAALKQTLLERQ